MTFQKLQYDVSRVLRFMEAFCALREKYPEKQFVIFCGYVEDHPSIHIFVWRYGVPTEPSIYYDTDKHCFVEPESSWVAVGCCRPNIVPKYVFGATFISWREQIVWEKHIAFYKKHEQL